MIYCHLITVSTRFCTQILAIACYLEKTNQDWQNSCPKQVLIQNPVEVLHWSACISGQPKWWSKHGQDLRPYGHQMMQETRFFTPKSIHFMCGPRCCNVLRSMPSSKACQARNGRPEVAFGRLVLSLAKGWGYEAGRMWGYGQTGCGGNSTTSSTSMSDWTMVYMIFSCSTRWTIWNKLCVKSHILL